MQTDILQISTEISLQTHNMWILKNHNYNLLSSSPAINAGESSTLDPDGSVSDIGAHYYHIYVVMDHVSLNNTNDTNGPYRVEAEISSPAGATLTGQLYYSVDGGEYLSLDMTPANNDTFYADIPGQGLIPVVSYYISALRMEKIQPRYHTTLLQVGIRSLYLYLTSLPIWVVRHKPTGI